MTAFGPHGAQVFEGLEEQSLRVGGGIQAVEDIAGHNDRIDFARLGDADNLRQRLAMFRLARPALQGRAEVPVGSVKNFDHGSVQTGQCCSRNRNLCASIESSRLPTAAAGVR